MPNSQGYWPRVELRRTTDQALAPGVFYVVSWESVVVDTHAMWAPALPTEIRPAYSGFYVGMFSAGLDNNFDPTLEFLVNGVRQQAFRVFSGGTAFQQATITVPLELGLNDIVTTHVRCNLPLATLVDAAVQLSRQGI